MATAALRFCSQPGCGTKVASGRCEQHQTRSHYDRARGSSTQRGYGADWQAKRKVWMRDRLFQEFKNECAVCHKRFTYGHEVIWDHIKALALKGSRLDDANVQPACIGCNTAKGSK